MDVLKLMHLERYFRNKELNHFYFSIILINFGIALISIFVPIYLYKLGYSISNIAIFYFLWSLSFVIISYPCSKIIAKIGVKHSILLATPFLILYYFSLNFIGSYHWLFYIAPLINALNSFFYWQGYHLFFFLHSHKTKIGKEVSMSRGLTFLSAAAAPLIGGFLATDSFTLLFLIGSFFIVVSSIPLFLTKENYIPQKFNLKSIYEDIILTKERKDFISFIGESIENTFEMFVWPIYLILVLGTFVKIGFIVAVTAGISLIGFYLSGILTDKYNKRRLIRITIFFNSIGWFLRSFANSLTSVFFINSYKKISEKFLHTPWNAQIYRMAGRRDYHKFIFFHQFSLHIIRIIFVPIIALIFYKNPNSFKLSFVLAGLFSLFYYFIKRK